MTQPPDDDQPLGGALSPEPEPTPEPSATPPPPPPPADAAFPPPPPPPPPSGAGAFPPPPAAGAYPPPPAAGAYPPPPPSAFPPAPAPGAYPPPPGAYPSAFPAGGAGLRPHRATQELILGVLGLLCCGILAIPAYLMSKKDIAEMDAGLMDPSGRSTANIARILGIIGMVFLAINVVVTVFWLVGGGLASGLSG